MKEKVSPAVVAVIIVVMVVVIGFIGMKVFGGGAKDASSADMQKKYNDMTKGGTVHPPSQDDMKMNPPAGVNTSGRNPMRNRPNGAPSGSGQ